MDKEVTIPFTREANGYVYHDTLILPHDHKLSQKEIVRLQNERFANWISSVDDGNKEKTEA